MVVIVGFCWLLLAIVGVAWEATRARDCDFHDDHPQLVELLWACHSVKHFINLNISATGILGAAGLTET